jgi:glycosyltransferase involved in cell wall biosynthesis
MRVLLVGHACGPDLGSEPGFTWNWAWHLAEHHQVWVLSHPERRARVERFLAEQPQPNLKFIWVAPDERWDPWRPERGERGIHLHYMLWQRKAFNTARRLHQEHHFDVVHHVSWGTLSAPPMLWRLNIPFVWGPIGGGQTAPAAFWRYFGRGWPREAIRTLRVRLLPLLPALRLAAGRSGLVLATNHETRSILDRAGAQRTRLFLDSGLPRAAIAAEPAWHAGRGGPLRLLWAGRLEPRKGLPLALQALTRVPDLSVTLDVAGDGPTRGEWQALAHALRLGDRVRFLGQVPRDHLTELFRRADAFVFSSLQDAFGSVVLEAMGHGLPVVTLDHQGVGTFVPPDAGFKVPVHRPREVVAGLGRALRQLAQSPELRRSQGLAALHFARAQAWDLRAAQATAWYEELAGAHRDF